MFICLIPSRSIFENEVSPVCTSSAVIYEMTLGTALNFTVGLLLREKSGNMTGTWAH